MFKGLKQSLHSNYQVTGCDTHNTHTQTDTAFYSLGCTEYIIQEAFARKQGIVRINLRICLLFTVNIQKCHDRSKVDSGPTSKSTL